MRQSGRSAMTDDETNFRARIVRGRCVRAHSARRHREGIVREFDRPLLRGPTQQGACCRREHIAQMQAAGELPVATHSPAVRISCEPVITVAETNPFSGRSNSTSQETGKIEKQRARALPPREVLGRGSHNTSPRAVVAHVTMDAYRAPRLDGRLEGISRATLRQDPQFNTIAEHLHTAPAAGTATRRRRKVSGANGKRDPLPARGLGENWIQHKNASEIMNRI